MDPNFHDDPIERNPTGAADSGMRAPSDGSGGARRAPETQSTAMARGAPVPLNAIDFGEADLREEAGLFAADLMFAERAAGPIGRAFLGRLPEAWRPGPLVIDASLVWLPPGARPGSLAWTHEPFPGVAGGVRGEANTERAAEHLAMIAGPAGVDFLTGEALAPERRAAGDPLHARHARLEAKRRAGEAALVSIAPGRRYRYRWGCFHRFQPAPTGGGFAFWIRATRGAARPWVNGIRNAVNI